jgi:hypothetical protein
MNSRHVKRIASPQADWGQREAYFALGMERRLWRGLRSFPGRPAYGRFPPNCGMHSAIRNVWFTSTPAVPERPLGGQAFAQCGLPPGSTRRPASAWPPPALPLMDGSVRASAPGGAHGLSLHLPAGGDDRKLSPTLTTASRTSSCGRPLTTQTARGFNRFVQQVEIVIVVGEFHDHQIKQYAPHITRELAIVFFGWQTSLIFLFAQSAQLFDVALKFRHPRYDVYGWYGLPR